MENEKLLAQIKAFKNYLKNYIGDVKSHNSTNKNQESEESKEELEANSYEINYIHNRYKQLRYEINQEHSDMFLNVSPNFSHNIRAIEHMYREVNYILDTISDLNNVEIEKQKFKTNNKPFTKDEIQIINNQLNDLQDKLIDVLDQQNLPTKKTVLIESIKSEIEDLKKEVTNPNLGRKDWKNHLISTMITLTFMLSFSQEARITIFNYFQSLLVFFQQHIFLLDS